MSALLYDPSKNAIGKKFKMKKNNDTTIKVATAMPRYLWNFRVDSGPNLMFLFEQIRMIKKEK
jgi:hypothetical protein